MDVARPSQVQVECIGGPCDGKEVMLEQLAFAKVATMTFPKHTGGYEERISPLTGLPQRCPIFSRLVYRRSDFGSTRFIFEGESR